MKLVELNQKIDVWATLNKLDKMPTSKQTLKIIEEIGELAEAMLKKDIHAQKDAIGDIYITLRVLMLQYKLTFEDDKLEDDDFCFIDNDDSFNVLALCNEVKNLPMRANYFFELLQDMAKFLELDFIECVEQAYDEVKDRNLKIVNGTAIKI
jgi:hypothetical protein